MAPTSSGSIVSSGAALFGVIMGAFATILSAVGTYTVGAELTGTLVTVFILVGIVVAVVATVGLSRGA